MTILDRYVLRLFVKVLFVLFVSISGLTILLDAFTNFADFHEHGQQQGGVVNVLMQYYGARLLAFFDRTSSLFCLLAAMFSMAWMQRTNEMTAIMAGGISERRVVKPLVWASIAVAVLAAADRELLLPQFRDKLTRNAQNWSGENPTPLKPRYDEENHILISGLHVIAAEQKIVKPSFRLHSQIGDFGRQIAAERAYYQSANSQRPAGFLLDGVQQPDDLASLATGRVGVEPIIFSPGDTPWLEARQCFIASGVEFEHLAASSSWADFASSAQLIRSLRNPSVEYGADVRVAIHRRFVQPALDLTLLFLGLPLVIARPNRNVFVVVGLCLLLVAGFFLVVMTCQALGANNYLLSPALAAWFPLLIFLPLAVGANRPQDHLSTAGDS